MYKSGVLFIEAGLVLQIVPHLNLGGNTVYGFNLKETFTFIIMARSVCVFDFSS